MPTHTVEKKIIYIDDAPFLEITSTYIEIVPKEDLEVQKVKEGKEKVKDEKKLKDIDDEIKMFPKKLNK